MDIYTNHKYDMSLNALLIIVYETQNEFLKNWLLKMLLE